MAVNKLLKNLDNGGFEIVVSDPPIPLNESDINFGNTYLDRYDKNQTKVFKKNKGQVMAWALIFQQTVEKLPNRFDVDLRYL